MTKGQIFNIQKYSIHDGPGIRTTVFLKGCPLSCIWCHNPESQSPEQQLLVYDKRCIGCGKCLGACIYGGVKLEGKQAFITEACRACGRCVEVCPQKALRITIDDPDYVQKAIAFLEPRVDLS